MLEVRAGTGGDEVCKEVNLTMSDHPTCLIIIRIVFKMILLVLVLEFFVSLHAR